MGTEHYNLKQWERWEGPGRAGLNAALAGVDAALCGKADQSTADGLSGQTAALRSRCAALEGRLEAVIGSYTGNGAASRTISLGFTPQAVLVEEATGMRMNSSGTLFGGMALPNAPSTGREGNTVEIVSGGFQVTQGTYIKSNQSGTIYRYLAFK